jgi:hypothetical protein
VMGAFSYHQRCTRHEFVSEHVWDCVVMMMNIFLVLHFSVGLFCETGKTIDYWFWLYGDSGLRSVGVIDVSVPRSSSHQWEGWRYLRWNHFLMNSIDSFHYT